MKVVIIVKTSVFDITKSVALVVLLLFGLFYANKIVNHFTDDSVKPPDEVLVEVSKNTKILQNIQSDTSELKDLKKELEGEDGLASKLVDAVEKENKKRDAKLDEIGVTVGKIDQTVTRTGVASVDKIPQLTGNAEEDARRNKLTFSKVDIEATATNGMKVPIAWAQYFPNKEGSERWRVGTYPIEYHETIIESQNKDGTFSRAAELHIENNNHKASKDLEFPIELTTLKWEKAKEREKSLYLWNPRLGLGMSATDTVVAPKLNISLASYGRTKVDMDWRFLTLGVGAVKDYTDAEGVESDLEVMGSFEPFAWNVGKAIPLVENMFAGPEMVAHSDGHMSYGVGISIPF